MLRNSGYCFLALLGAAFAAFWPKYLSRPPHEIDAYTHIHAAAMVAWCGLLVVQPFLIRSQHVSVHRSLGALSYGLVPVILVASLLLAHNRFRSMDAVTFHSEARNLYLPLSALALFCLAYGCGMIFRRTPSLHARFMVCTSLTMIDPIFGRILAFYLPPLPKYLYYQVVTFGAVDLILLGLALRDRRRAQGGWVFFAMLLVFMVTHVLWFTAAQSDGWRVVAGWFRSLPLT